MPRMDGMELLRRLREFTEMPVIFLTSKDEEIDELLGLRMGADDYIAKPIKREALLDRVGKWFLAEKDHPVNNQKIDDPENEKVLID